MRLIIITCMFFLAGLVLYGQDRQYWDQAVGGRTALLGGIAVGGVRDYSATFYNPGALGFIHKNSMNFNFNMYGIKNFYFQEGGGPNIDSRYTRVSLYPASLAGPLSFLGDSTNRFSYMIYGNGYSYVRISERYEGYDDVIPSRTPSVPGMDSAFKDAEFLINQGKLDALLSEVSVGFGYGKKLSDNISLGFTLIGAYRDQTKIRIESYSAFDSTYQRAATTDIYTETDYWAVRFSGKFGISAEFEDMKFGATITTPSISMKIASGGTDHASLTSNNVYTVLDSANNEVLPVDIIASERQEGLAVDYRTPFSISAGIEYKLSEATLAHVACEFFAPISTYVVMQPQSSQFIRNSPTRLENIDSAELLKIYDSMKAVFNFGLALEHKFDEKFSGYTAFRTDFSNANYEDIHGLAIGFTDINIYHCTIGASVNMDDRFIGIGFEYSFGSRNDFKQIFNFPTGALEPSDVAILSNRGTCKAIYSNFNIFIGVTQLL